MYTNYYKIYYTINNSPIYIYIYIYIGVLVCCKHRVPYYHTIYSVIIGCTVCVYIYTTIYNTHKIVLHNNIVYILCNTLEFRI